MPRQWTEADSEAMNAAAEAAEKELIDLVKNSDPLFSAVDLMRFHASHFMTVGHKRLGRLYVKLATEYGE